MKKLMCLFFTGFVFYSTAQKNTNPVLFGSTISPQNLKEYLYQIAGPAFEGRETATEGQRKAAGYIEENFRRLHLQPANRDSYQYSFPLYQDSLVSSALQINGKDFQINQDYSNRYMMLAYPFSIAVSDIVFAGYGLSDSLRNDYRGINAAGKIVMVLNTFPPGYVQTQISRRKYNPRAKLDAAMQHGAAAVFVIQEDFPRKSAYDPSFMYTNFFKPEITPNFFYISEKIAREIMGNDFDLITTGSVMPKIYKAEIFVSYQKLTKMLHSSEVVGYLEGTDLKDEWLVISAHYDHLGKKDSVIYFGADDDGSGTVSLLELADAFSKSKAAGFGPRRSILFLANSGEEKGLLGSEFYTNYPLFPLDKTTADLNIDMIGRKDPGRKQGDSNNYIYIVGDDKLSTDLRPVVMDVNRKYAHLELDYKFNDPHDPLKIFSRSDHYNFARKGVPIVFYFDGINNDYHKPTDTPDKINYELMAKRVRLVFYTAWELANRNEILRRNLPAVE